MRNLILKIAKENPKFRRELIRKLASSNEVETIVDIVLYELGAKPETWSSRDFNSLVLQTQKNINSKMFPIEIVQEIYRYARKVNPKFQQQTSYKNIVRLVSPSILKLRRNL